MTKRFESAITCYSGIDFAGAWHQEFANGIRIYDLADGDFREILYNPKEHIGVPFNLVFQVEGKILR